jgi:molecular chaperone GrpE (heat shock protein)
MFAEASDVQEPPEEDLADAEPEPGHKDKLIKQLEKQLEEFTNNWKAAQAENENVRKIMTRGTFCFENPRSFFSDVSRAREGGIDKLAKKLFPMSDTLDICIQNKPNFESPEHKENVHAQRAFDGIHAAKQQLLSILKQFNVEEVVPQKGATVSKLKYLQHWLTIQFDPAFHDALFEVDPPQDKSLPPGSIGMVLKVGWKRDSVLLR